MTATIETPTVGQDNLTIEQINSLPIGSEVCLTCTPTSVGTDVPHMVWRKIADRDWHLFRTDLLTQQGDHSENGDAFVGNWRIHKIAETERDLTVCPFPMLNGLVISAEQMDALPVGSVIRHGEDPVYAIKQSDQSWIDCNDVGSIGDVRVRTMSGDYGFAAGNDVIYVHGLPVLDIEQAQALPVGALVWCHRHADEYNPIPRGMWRKTLRESGEFTDYSDAWQAVVDNAERNGLIFNGEYGSMYLVDDNRPADVTNETANESSSSEPQVGDTTGDQDYIDALPIGTSIALGTRARGRWVKRENDRYGWYLLGADVPVSEDMTATGRKLTGALDGGQWHIVRIGPPVETTEADATEQQITGEADAVVIPWQSVRQGMVVSPTSNLNLRIFVVGEVSGNLARCVTYRIDVGQMFTETRDLGTYVEYQVVRETPVMRQLLTMFTTTVTADESQRLVNEARQAGVEQERNSWKEKMSRLNIAAQEWADNHDMCHRYDEFVSGWSEMGLTPRKRTYTVRIPINGYIERSYEATDEDDAIQQFDEYHGFQTDYEYQMNGETFTVEEIDRSSASAEVE